MAFNIKSLFIETDNNKQESKKIEQQIQPSINSQDLSTNINNNVEMNQDILNKLCSFMESCNLPGPDYMELKKATNSEGMKVIPDIGVRFQAAFATLKSMHPNLSKQIILDSIDAYINELQKQNNIAKEQIETKRKKEVIDKQNIIADKETQIKKLQDEIVKISSEMLKMKEEVKNAEDECNKNINEFNASVNLLINNLITDKNKISETLID